MNVMIAGIKCVRASRVSAVLYIRVSCTECQQINKKAVCAEVSG